MDTLLKFGELFKDPKENLEILGTKKSSPGNDYCEHCGKNTKKLVVFRDKNTGMYIYYGVNHAAEILGYPMKEFKRILNKANRVMLLKFMPKYKKHKLYPYLRNARSKKEREVIRAIILPQIELPNFFLPDVNAKGS